MEKNSNTLPDPSLNQLKQTIIMEIGLPLGMGFFPANLTVNPEVFNDKKLEALGNDPKTKSRDKDDLESEKPSLFDPKKEKSIQNNKCFLFYGPKGTGKEMMVKALAYETNSLLFSKSYFKSNHYIFCLGVFDIFLTHYKVWLWRSKQPIIERTWFGPNEWLLCGQDPHLSNSVYHF